MTWLESILLGVVQGLTEFLPVSSDGHLSAVEMLLPRFRQVGVLFDRIATSPEAVVSIDGIRERYGYDMLRIALGASRSRR